MFTDFINYCNAQLLLQQFVNNDRQAPRALVITGVFLPKVEIMPPMQNRRLIHNIASIHISFFDKADIGERVRPYPAATLFLRVNTNRLHFTDTKLIKIWAKCITDIGLLKTTEISIFSIVNYFADQYRYWRFYLVCTRWHTKKK